MKIIMLNDIFQKSIDTHNWEPCKQENCSGFIPFYEYDKYASCKDCKLMIYNSIDGFYDFVWAPDIKHQFTCAERQLINIIH